MKHYSLAAVILCLLAFNNLPAQNPVISTIVQSVSGDSVFRTISDLQPMNRVTSYNSLVPADYLKQRLLDYNVDTVFYQFFKPGTPPNVVGIKYGKQYPNEYWVMGAHYDAVLPGAGSDDNGSGTAAVVEMARVTNGYNLDKSLMLVLFAAEEVGLWGSDAFVDSAVNHFPVHGMINLDMIAYSHNMADSSVSVCYRYFCLDLLDDFTNASTLYVPELKIDTDSTGSLIYASDHVAFWNRMIPALFLIENSDRWGGSFNPFYHSYDDTIGMGANSRWLAEKITRSTIATLLSIINPTLSSITELNTSPDKVTVYPNPFKDALNIELPENMTEAHIALYNLVGKQVLGKPISGNDQPRTVTLDTSSLEPGIYLIHLGSKNGGRFIGKVVKR